MINEKALQDMISKVKDPGLRNQLNNIVSGKVVKQVHCQSKSCQGTVIANIYVDGHIEGVNTFNKEGRLVSGLFGSRPRLDGQMGFQCACLNDSRLAEAEDGIITEKVPTKEDLDKVYKNLQKNPKPYQEKSGKLEVDGFIIETIKV